MHFLSLAPRLYVLQNKTDHPSPKIEEVFLSKNVHWILYDNVISCTIDFAGEGLEYKQWVLFCDIHGTHRGNYWSYVQPERTGRHLSFARWNSPGIRPQQVTVP